jgi:hypothetical protein
VRHYEAGPAGHPDLTQGGRRIVARVETVAKGANVDAVVTDWGVRRRDGRVARSVALSFPWSGP